MNFFIFCRIHGDILFHLLGKNSFNDFYLKKNTKGQLCNYVYGSYCLRSTNNQSVCCCPKGINLFY